MFHYRIKANDRNYNIKTRKKLSVVELKSVLESKTRTKVNDILVENITAQMASGVAQDNEANRPSTKYIGTGEGIGIEGWGLYFSTNKRTHDYYVRTVAKRTKSHIVDLNVDDTNLIFYDFLLSDAFKTIGMIPNWFKKCVRETVFPNKEKIKDLAENIETLRGRKKILNNVNELISSDNVKSFTNLLTTSMNGFMFYMLVEYILNGNNLELISTGSDDSSWGKQASLYLLKCGCRGIKYLDHGSREFDTDYYTKDIPSNPQILSRTYKNKINQEILRRKKEDKNNNEPLMNITFNYVIFDEKFVTIKWRKDDTSDKFNPYQGQVDSLKGNKSAGSIGKVNTFEDVSKLFSKEKFKSIPEWVTLENAKNAQYCFSQCTELQKLPDGLLLDKAVNLKGCFNECASLTELPSKMTLRNGAIFDQCFGRCTRLLSIPDGVLFDEAQSVISCFNGCINLRELNDKITFSNVIKADGCFQKCEQLKSIPSSITFDKATSMNSCFAGCYNIVSLPNLSCKNAINMYRCFSNCIRLESLPETLDLSKAKNMEGCFFICNSLKHLPKNMNLASASNMHRCFAACTELEIDDIIRVCLTLKMGTGKPLGLPDMCKHNGEKIYTKAYLEENSKDFVNTMSSKNWRLDFY